VFRKIHFVKTGKHLEFLDELERKLYESLALLSEARRLGFLPRERGTLEVSFGESDKLPKLYLVKTGEKGDESNDE
jgi:hypothetical protein